MHFTSSVVVLSGLAALAAAAPAPDAAKAKKGSSYGTAKPVGGSLKFSVQQKSLGKKLITYPPKQVLNTYAKFNKKAPTAVKSAAAAGVSGSVANNPLSYDEAYLSPVTVGGVSMNLNFDTGSSDLWVYSDLLPSTSQTGHDIYKTSSGVQMQGYTWAITYGDGSGASGKVYADKVVVGGVTATSQAVEAATSVSKAFLSDTHSDGLLGLAFSTINTVEPNQQTTFFDTVKSSLALPLFTSTLKKGQPGTYDFGYIDSAKYKGNISYVPVYQDNGFWEFNAGSYIVGKTKFSAAIGDSIADTGTTLLYLPARVVSNYYAQVKGATLNKSYGGWVFPCASTMPDLTITLGSGTFTVPGSYINYSPISRSTCFGGVQPNTGIGFSIFGDIFLKSVFTVWDMTSGNTRLGFAKQA
ncbi:aspartic protease-like protein [Elsinoe australis]|uniref:Aspartic protease-like protein n=1 Tax=Elsinoe australis TaxID=40998 RepID=A0A4U7ANC7_9PEZI|nr:aspartic protease-like protein [Elsinoe australis]